MKYNLLLLSFLFLVPSLIAQKMQTDYPKKWKQIDSLIQKKGLTESAKLETEKIFQTAKKEKNEAQQIKALIYLAGLREMKEENATPLSIKQWEKELPALSPAGKAVLNSYLGDLYLSYYEDRRWDLLSQTTLKTKDENDLTTWSNTDLIEKTGRCYTKSLEPATILQAIPIESFNPLIIPGNSRPLRPTLYDLLANKAIEHASMYEPEWKKQIPVEKIYAELIRFHKQDKESSARLDAELGLLNWKHSERININPDIDYMRNLKEWMKVNDSHPFSARAAASYAESIISYPVDTINKYREALEVCEKYSTKFSGSEGAQLCENIKYRILQPTLQLESEKVILPDESFRLLIHYKNIKALYYRIIKLTGTQKEKLNRSDQEQLLAYLNTLTPIFQGSQLLPAGNDHYNHSVELALKGLPAGEYCILGSTDPEFKSKEEVHQYVFFTSSSIAWFRNNEHLYVVNRKSGIPLQGAIVQCKLEEYDYKSGKYIETIGPRLVTDADGYAKLSVDKGYQLQIFYDGQELNTKDRVYAAARNNGNQDSAIRTQVFFYTDRSLYRPGQTVHFKAITVRGSRSKKEFTAPSPFEIKFILKDANNQIIDTLVQHTNEFGSASGRFTLPMDRLKGYYSITADKLGSVINFSVEEYKRPRFEVKFDAVTKTYKLKDTIHVKGNAFAYAGPAIEKAQVRYRVLRNERFPDFWWRQLYFPNRGVSEEIAFGTTITDKNGEFQIHFESRPDTTVPVEWNPVFDYRVSVDVTDINGETHSTTTQVRVGYRSMEMRFGNMENILPASQFEKINVNLFNMQGQRLQKKVALKVFSLSSPNKLLRKRIWETPDQFLMDEETFRKWFPEDEYRNELNPSTWNKRDMVHEQSDTIPLSGSIKWKKNNWEAGWYLLEATSVDDYGEEVKTQTYIALTDPKNSTFSPDWIWSKGNEKLSPGETLNYLLGTGKEKMHVLRWEKRVSISEKTRKDSIYWIDTKSSFISSTFPIREIDRGGWGLSHSFVYNNRFYSKTTWIDVPWDNKELKIDVVSWRDRTLPGSEETWKIRVRDHQGKTVPVEILSTLYDASLNQLKPHQWNTWNIYPRAYLGGGWDAGHNFLRQGSWGLIPPIKQVAVNQRMYDQFIQIFIDERGQLFGTRRMPGMDNLKVLQYNNADVSLSEKVYTKREAGQADQLVTPAIPIENESKANIPAARFRKDFRETAFFLPEIRTDENGDASLHFTMPDALTTWQWMILAHTRDGRMSVLTQQALTQKELMVECQSPRFIREGDKIFLRAKVSNLTDKELTGSAVLELIDPETNQSIDGWFKNIFPQQYFTSEANGNTYVTFQLEAPYSYTKPLLYRIRATAGQHTDGEENTIPVLANRKFITETMPMSVRRGETKSYTLNNLLINNSETINHHALTLEWTSNPAWYGVMALPYLKERKEDHLSSMILRYYANAVALAILKKNPGMETILNQWREKDSTVFESPLLQNAALKQILLQETPWVLDAKSETAQRKAILELFDRKKIEKELADTWDKISQFQSSNGGFFWVKGHPEDRYMTLRIVYMMGRLRQLNALPGENARDISPLIKKAITYIDLALQKDYLEDLKRKDKFSSILYRYNNISHLYARGAWKEIVFEKDTRKAYEFYLKQIKNNWTKLSLPDQALAALTYHQISDQPISRDILRSLKERSLSDPERGMYWKADNSWLWRESDISAQALLIEAFWIIDRDTSSVTEMKRWLLSQKQTRRWSSAQATADACHALFLDGLDQLTASSEMNLQWGGKTYKASEYSTIPGLGYGKITLEGKQIKPEDATIKLSASGNTTSSAWAALYWQYFEQIEKIKESEGPLRIERELYKQIMTSKGPVLQKVSDTTAFEVGDRCVSRIVIHSDRVMNYIHLRDLRASGMEPVDAISRYEWKGGLSYYHTTGDVSTDFFIPEIGKGKYVIEYSLFISHSGHYGAGLSEIQCLYAPSLSAHSEGQRMKVPE